MFLLDTNVISELRKPRPHGAVVAWLRGVSEADVNLSAVTLAELQIGIERTRDIDTAKAAEIEAWADLVAASHQVLPMDGSTFRLWARLMHRQPDSLYEDAMIAATAIINSLTVVTSNTHVFDRFRVPTLNPFL